ncbi:alpha/beta fold hydrolase [Streptomyces sp. HSG2]|uniref:thioesterase II family protein n=1 Tax=Streptomyces sp. HSG2 TaxID=2797167 RepID=UPI001905D3B1|nr:alpha/beta fold hydrolase [Streptomyces sp. HSG2]
MGRLLPARSRHRRRRPHSLRPTGGTRPQPVTLAPHPRQRAAEHRLHDQRRLPISTPCLPPAGGTAQAYARWAGHLPDGTEVAAVELPGHGSRMGEPPLTRMADVVEGIETALAARPELPLVIFGHSMGGGRPTPTPDPAPTSGSWPGLTRRVSASRGGRRHPAE